MEVFEMEKEFNDLMKKGKELLDKMKENHFADVNKKVRWKPKDGDVYYYINTSGDIDKFVWFGVSGSTVDNKLYKINNCFQTREEAQKELDRRIVERELLDLADWEKDKPCYEIEYNFKEKCFEGDVCCSSSCYSSYRFATKESCQKAIDTLGTERLKLIFRID